MSTVSYVIVNIYATLSHVYLYTPYTTIITIYLPNRILIPPHAHFIRFSELSFIFKFFQFFIREMDNDIEIEQESDIYSLRFKKNTQLPPSYKLVIGTKGIGSILLKSVRGITSTPSDEIVYKNGNSYGKVYVVGTTVLLVVDNTHQSYDNSIISSNIKTILYEKSSQIVIIESVSQSILQSHGYDQIQVSYDNNHYEMFDNDHMCETMPLIGFEMSSIMNGKPVRYFLIVLHDNTIDIKDCKETVAFIASHNESIDIDFDRVKYYYKLMLQESSYL